MAVATVQLHTGQTVHLGRRRPIQERVQNVLRLRDYLRPTAAPPDVLDLSVKAASAIAQMYLNDQEGDCVIAGKGHSVGIWTGNETGTPVIATDAEIQSAYTGICGPGDQGCVITDVLDTFKNTGLTLGGQLHRIVGYVAVDWTNKLEVQIATYLFGPLTFGINLPQGWADAKDLWDVVSGAAASIVGGHDVCSYGYDTTGVGICTWASKRTITWAAMASKTWVEELYAILSPDWISINNLSPMGVDVIALQSDLAALGGGTIPPFPGPGQRPPLHRHPHHHHHHRHR